MEGAFSARPLPYPSFFALACVRGGLEWREHQAHAFPLPPGMGCWHGGDFVAACFMPPSHVSFFESTRYRGVT